MERESPLLRPRHVHDRRRPGRGRFGGRITEGERETETALHYPGWEVMYRMAFLSQLEQDLVLIFHHPLAQVHELDLVDHEHAGREVITELVGAWRPRVVVVAGARQAREMYGTTVVVSPGHLDQGQYTVFDTHRSMQAVFRTIIPATPSPGC